jgi:hypothetical protein
MHMSLILDKTRVLPALKGVLDTSVSRTIKTIEWQQAGKKMETVGLDFELPSEIAETVRERHSEGDIRLVFPGSGE